MYLNPPQHADTPLLPGTIQQATGGLRYYQLAVEYVNAAHQNPTWYGTGQLREAHLYDIGLAALPISMTYPAFFRLCTRPMFMHELMVVEMHLHSRSQWFSGPPAPILCSHLITLAHSLKLMFEPPTHDYLLGGRYAFTIAT